MSTAKQANIAQPLLCLAFVTLLIVTAPLADVIRTKPLVFACILAGAIGVFGCRALLRLIALRSSSLQRRLVFFTFAFLLVASAGLFYSEVNYSAFSLLFLLLSITLFTASWSLASVKSFSGFLSLLSLGYIFVFTEATEGFYFYQAGVLCEYFSRTTN